MSGNKVNAQFYYHPRYYGNFVCTGGECPMNCCFEWQVDWKREEVEKLKNADCSEALRRLIGSSFKENGEKYMIAMNDKKRCPFLTEDNFCGIQREIGEEYLSMVCRIYPRGTQIIGNTVMNYCNLSCYRIMDMLCSDRDSMILEKELIKKSKPIGVFAVSGDNNYIKKPVMKYRKEIFELFYDIISDESHSLETSVTLGAVAAQSLTRVAESGKYDLIPKSIEDIKVQIKNPEQIHKLENLKPNYNLKIGFAYKLNDLLFKSNMFDLISENGAISIDKYNIGLKNFYAAFEDRPFAMRNIALNFLMELKMPFKNKDMSIFDNYCYFAASVASMKMLAASVYYNSVDPEKVFKTTAAHMSRGLSHKEQNVKAVIDLFKEMHCTSPAYIALIMK